MRRAKTPRKRPVTAPETVILLAALPVEEALAPLAVLLGDLVEEEVTPAELEELALVEVVVELAALELNGTAAGDVSNAP